MNYSIDELIGRMNELFITWRQNYIYQVKDGSYVDSIKFGGKLTDKEIKEHLQRNKTIGIKVNKVTKFIAFDVDVADEFQKQKFVVKKIKNAIKEFGIPSEYIYVANSGSKGYHCFLFIDDAIPLTYVNTLYKYVLEYTDCNIHEIELRPTNLGIKLPLSINKKTGNICWFVDEIFKPIERQDYIFEIRQYSAEILIELIKDYENETKGLKELSSNIDGNFILPKSHKENIDKEYTFQIAEEIEQNGIIFKGSRHNCLMKLASMYYTLGFDKIEMIKELVQWMDRQDKNMYSTPYDRCLKDINEIVEYIINNNIQLTTDIKEITIDKDEALKITKIKGNKGQLIMYCLLVHSKRYSNKTGIFYMTYNQIMKSCNVNSKHTIKKYIDELENMGYINIVRRNNYFDKLPNQYIVNIISSNTGYIVNENIINLEESYNRCMVNIFNKQELKEIFSRREYERLIG